MVFPVRCLAGETLQVLEQNTSQRKHGGTIFTALLFPIMCPDAVATPGKLIQAAIHIPPR